MGKEAYDDYKRNLRDREANSQRYLVLDPSPSATSTPHRKSTSRSPSHHHRTASHPEDDEDLESGRLNSHDDLPHMYTRSVPSSSLRVGDLVMLEKNQRVPADLVLLRTSDTSGTCFIRTDQLDGETDWKLRVAVPATQKLPSEAELGGLDAEIYGALFLSVGKRTVTNVFFVCTICSRRSYQGHSHLHRHFHDQLTSL